MCVKEQAISERISFAPLKTVGAYLLLPLQLGLVWFQVPSLVQRNLLRPFPGESIKCPGLQRYITEWLKVKSLPK